MIFIPPSAAEHAAIAATLPKVRLMLSEQALSQRRGGAFSHLDAATGKFQKDVPIVG